ncbi:hypothetical protein G9A89_009407 [Geosiphon pyriformis]|nr:hypothetical protein G9A89_009407 [Geosiphon pyriformis]
MDRLVKSLRSVSICGNTAAYFSDINLSIAAIVFTLDCIPALSSVILFLDSQAFLNMCVLVGNCVKEHSGVVDNKHANFFTGAIIKSKFVLSVEISYCFLVIKGRSVSGNTYCFVRNNTATTKFKVATTPDTTTLEYYQSIYTHCKQRFNIPDGIEVVKKSVYQYIENCINNYLFGNYNISKVRSNFYNNLAHYSQLGTENLNSKTLATYFHKLNFNIIKYCEETYPVQFQYSIDFELETETSNKGKNKLKQYSKTTPNTPTLPKTTAKHLQTPEQGTSSKLPLIITPFSASLAQAQTPNSHLNQFTRPEDFTSLRSLIRQQEPLQTSSNFLDFLAENQNEHSETAANKENEPEIFEKELIDSKNEKDEMTTYIAKILEFNGEDIETSLQKWLDQVTKAGDANG